MAPAQVVVPSAIGTLPVQPSLKPSAQQTVQERHESDGEASIQTVDALIRHRARSNPYAPIVSYPSSGIEFVDYSMQQLDVFAYRAARHYQSWIPTRKSSAVKPTTVALLGPSNFDYLITMLALTKLGHTVLFLSTRISQLAIESLIETTGATYLLADSRYLQTASKVKENLAHIEVAEIAGETVYDFPIEVHADTRMDYQLDQSVETLNNIYIIHSSGSTGLPKPIYQPHKSAIANYAVSMDMKAFITLPLYHNHGICNLFRAIYAGKPIHLYNADLPLTQSYLTKILREHQFEIFYGVPYALKLLAESDEGIELLKQLKIVMYGGSACPDTLGNLLVEQGVNLVGHYGATEVGQLMTSFRPAGDKAWNYVRESDKLKPYLKWIPRGPNLYECSVLDGWPSKVASNMPDGSYATKDLFEPHPTIEAAWKYIARLDDTIALVNGEKFNPVMMEGMIRSHKAVNETIIFGAGRPYLGILVVPSSATEGQSEEQIVDQIFAEIDAANQTVEAYARISRDMVKILPRDCEFPRTDKGSVIRQAFYKQFAKEINDAYDSVAVSNANLKTLALDELQDFIRDVLQKALTDVKEIQFDTDFFSLGLDSLQSIQMRMEILKTVDIGNNQLGQNVVFEYPSIEMLSAYLFGLRTGQAMEKKSVEADISDLIDKYGYFPPRVSQHSVVVTGATGSLGAHVVAQLAPRSDISRIYCLVRAQNSEDALRRVRRSLVQRKIYHTLSRLPRSKITAFPSDFSDPRLGLSDDTYAEITSNLRSVIHCAWSVNFNIGLSSFEKDCVAGVRHLLDLCHAVSAPQPASFDFCSSVSTVARCPSQRAPESLPEASWAQNMGYAQSKLVAENLCRRAAQATGIRARILRVGQIVADTVHGVWNAMEGIPMIMQTALTVGALPKLREAPSWTPVDVVAKSVTEIALSEAGSIVANVTNPVCFSWTDDLLPALRNAGLEFEVVEPKEWVRRLRASNPDPAANPPIKLVEFFASKYDRHEFPTSRTYATETACEFSPALASAPVLDQDFVNKFIKQFQRTTWKTPSTPTPEPSQRRQVLILAGPCGSGKSTIAQTLSKHLDAPFIEGDSLHSRDAVSRMKRGEPLQDSDRIPWLGRLKRSAREILDDLGYERVIVSCSALKRGYRDQLRDMGDGVEVRFVDLQCEREELVRRLEGRTGHYMSVEMVDGQLEAYEEPGVEELDVLPVDAGEDIEEIVKGVLEGLEVDGGF
ncbi:male sterility protein [Zopfia rhizophila CBS 207.26]|uniref:gluconokinase n=1 Tax=Zopfia rhizophila CBS 207.26 TaxID=1314779 RepID=A0A6A6DG59_9PEZI|nr:male sterility protein [Zopfia rhizophila CBS 207.26]